MFDAYNPYSSLTYSNPYQPVYRNQSPVWQGTRFVSGLSEAQSYPVSLGTKILLMDSQEDKFYIKESDFNGISTISQYRFSRIEEPREQGENYITREEFNQWKENYESAIRQQYAAATQPTSTGAGSSIPENNVSNAATGTEPSSGISQEQFHFD